MHSILPLSLGKRTTVLHDLASPVYTFLVSLTPCHVSFVERTPVSRTILHINSVLIMLKNFKANHKLVLSYLHKWLAGLCQLDTWITF